MAFFLVTDLVLGCKIDQILTNESNLTIKANSTAITAACTNCCWGDLSHPLEITSSKPVLSIGFAYTDNEKQSHFCGID